MLNEMKSRFLSGKKIIFLISVGLFTFLNAQGITNTLGGNTAADKFIIENSDSDIGVVVTGEGKVEIGTTYSQAKLSVGAGSTAYAIYGETAGVSGSGVLGIASNNGSVYNYGGIFRSAGEFGAGVYGDATGNYGNGVYGDATGNYGNGVFGRATGSNGTGVYGDAFGSNGIGVYGEATNTGNVTNHGGFFRALGITGHGVRGDAPGEYGQGVYGYTTGNYGSGVYGEANNNGDVRNYGGYFKAFGQTGYGVFGWATGSNGTGVVGKGEAYDFDAIGNGVNYGSTSSIRWKNNVVEIDKPLEKLAQLRGVYFDWDKEHGGQHDVGCIAEEVGKVLPEIVVYEENGIDANGMDYSKLTPLLIEAIKALQKRVEILENR